MESLCFNGLFRAAKRVGEIDPVNRFWIWQSSISPGDLVGPDGLHRSVPPASTNRWRKGNAMPCVLAFSEIGCWVARAVPT